MARAAGVAAPRSRGQNPVVAWACRAIFTAILAVKPYFSRDPDDRETLRRHPLAMVVGILAVVIVAV